MREVVYTTESRLRRPGVLVRDMLRDLFASRELAWRLFVRNTSAKYRQTMFGYVWAFLPPIVGTVVFLFLRRSGLFAVGETEVPYALFLLAGMVLWQIASVPWGELPGRVRRYLLSMTYIYQFMAIGAACIAVLIFL